MIKNFYELDVWQKAHRLVIDIYKLAKGFPSSEKYGLTSQLQRAAVSITCNIAEGFGRYHFKDKTRFYYQARASTSEVQNLLFVARDVGYADHDTVNNLFNRSNDILAMLNGLINSVIELSNTK
jgi:four helix bundle protein